MFPIFSQGFTWLYGNCSRFAVSVHNKNIHLQVVVNRIFHWQGAICPSHGNLWNYKFNFTTSSLEYWIFSGLMPIDEQLLDILPTVPLPISLFAVLHPGSFLGRSSVEQFYLRKQQSGGCFLSSLSPWTWPPTQHEEWYRVYQHSQYTTLNHSHQWPKDVFCLSTWHSKRVEKNGLQKSIFYFISFALVTNLPQACIPKSIKMVQEPQNFITLTLKDK